MKSGLGRQERQMLAYLQMRGKRTVRTGELLAPLRLSREQERELFRRMARGGLIARVRRGLYLVPARLPLGGSWTPDETLVLETLMEDRGGRYQICGPSAFNRYGFIEQIPTRVFAYNNRLSGERTVGSVALVLIKVDDPRLGDTEQAGANGSPVYSSRTRTLVDAVYDWSRFDSLPLAYGWIRRELAARRVRASALVDTTLRYTDTGTLRRMGVLLEREEVADPLLRRIRRALRPTTSTIPWIPALPKRGTVDRRWGVVVNGRA